MKEALKERGLPVSGNKHVLIERLESSEGLEGSPEENTEFGLFIAGGVAAFITVILGMIVLTLIITFLVTGNPDQIERFESGASGVAIDDDNFVYVTQQDTVVKYSVIEDDDGTLSLKEEYASPALLSGSGDDVTHLFTEDNYVYAVRGSYIHMIEDSGQNFGAVSSVELDNRASGIVVSGDYAYVSISHEYADDSVEVYDVSNDFQHIGSVHRSLSTRSGESDEVISKGDIKGIATNDEYLYALINSCFKPESKGDEDPFPFFCKDHIYVWKLETIESLVASDQLDGAVPVDSSMSMRGFLWFKQWYSTIGANGDYVYLGDDGWGTGIVVVDFSDYKDPKKVHSYGRTIDEYPSGNYEGAGIAANDDFIVVSTAGEPTFKEGASIAGSGDGIYIGKIDGDDDGVPLGKDAFPDWKYVSSNWELCAFLVLIFGLPISISAGRSEIASQKTRKAEDRAKAEQSITELKDTIDRLKSKGIDTTDLERVLAQCEAEKDFQKADRLARQAEADGTVRESQYRAVEEKMTELKAKITEFKEKGVNTDELEKILKKAEKEVKK